MARTAFSPSQYACTLFREGDLALTKSIIEIVEDGRVKYDNSTGKNLYDFIYAGNAAEAHILAAKRLLKASRAKETIPQELRVDGEAFFTTNDEPELFADKEIWVIPLGVVCFFVTILEWSNWPPPLEDGPYLPL
jgi:sterol-4alpha-carboxylate 3-dehydrogenase (decarboxylating)